jgi:hypothetical protein
MDLVDVFAWSSVPKSCERINFSTSPSPLRLSVDGQTFLNELLLVVHFFNDKNAFVHTTGYHVTVPIQELTQPSISMKWRIELLQLITGVVRELSRTLSWWPGRF